MRVPASLFATCHRPNGLKAQVAAVAVVAAVCGPNSTNSARQG